MTGKELIFPFSVCCSCTARLMVILESKCKGKEFYIDRKILILLIPASSETTLTQVCCLILSAYILQKKFKEIWVLAGSTHKESFSAGHLPSFEKVE